jgi:hypothetical protein
LQFFKTNRSHIVLSLKELHEMCGCDFGLAGAGWVFWELSSKGVSKCPALLGSKQPDNAVVCAIRTDNIVIFVRFTTVQARR